MRTHPADRLDVRRSSVLLRASCCALSTCLLIACGPTADETEQEAGPPQVLVVNYPLAYFAERIGGEYVSVGFPAPADLDPAFWQPDEKVVAQFQAADLVLLNGASYAKWVPHATLPESRLVDTSRGARAKYIETEDAVVHSHGPEGMHSHAGTAFTTWLDPEIAIVQARAVRDALIELVPDRAETFRANCTTLEVDLKSIDEQLKSVVADAPETPVFFSHPVYQYLQRSCALNGESVHWEPGEMPDDAMWKDFVTKREHHPAKWMIWEGSPDPAIVARLEDVGIRSIVFDPCGNRPENGDYLSVMQSNAESMGEVFTR